ncbi:hypothetical protein [Thiobacillus sp.]
MHPTNQTRRISFFAARRRGSQPLGQFPAACILDDVLTDQSPHYLRGRKIALRADFLEQFLFFGIDQNGEPGCAIFHDDRVAIGMLIILAL